MKTSEAEVSNIEVLCAEESQSRLSTFQTSFGKAEWRQMESDVAAGREVTVKAPFGFGRGSEHMWVTVDSVDMRARAVTGRLANVPLWAVDLRLGHGVIVRFEDIEDLRTSMGTKEKHK